MIIERIEIRNFRSLREIDLDCSELTTILGRNGAGKSTILKALDVFYNVSYQASPYDYFGKDTTGEIRIRVTYSELRPDELQEFSPYLANNKLTVTKVINTGGAKYYGVSKQIPKFYEFRKLPAIKKRQGLNEAIDNSEFVGLGPKVTSEAAADQLMEQYEAAHPELTQPFEREQQFFGPRNVGGGKLDKYTKFVLIPAVRDASIEADKRGVMHQLIDVLVARTVNARADVRLLNAEFEQRVKAVYSRDNLTELGTLAATITKLLAQYAPGAELDLDFEDITPPKITLPGALASLVEDNFSSPISYTGHGVQRALILALLQQLSITDLTAPDPKAAGEEPAAQNAINVRPADLILAIEEPELYLHPSRSRYLSSVLNRLSKKPDNPNDPRTQIIYGTHSPYFINLDQFDRLRLSRKIPTPGLDIRQCRITAFTRQKAATRLSEISGKDPATFTAQSFVAHAVPVMNSIVNEGFFADVVVVVEGLSEVGVLWALQEILGKGWEALGIAVVPAGGKNNIDRPVVVFSGLDIPTYFIFDGDAHHTGKDKEDSVVRNRKYQKLAGVENIVDFPATQAKKTWAVFHERLESELKSAIGVANYELLCQEVAEGLGFDESSKALKNSEGASIFVNAAYRKGYKVPVLEEIVSHITALRKQ
jgi:energy-coupling factor transporter ATP-binding protein EcfA2